MKLLKVKATSYLKEFRVYSDDLELFYGRAYLKNNQWEAISISGKVTVGYNTKFKAGKFLEGNYKEDAQHMRDQINKHIQEDLIEREKLNEVSKSII